MAVQKFLQWARTASPAELAEGAGALARVFLYGDLPEPEREEARLTLTGLLDDSLPLVRRALAESFAAPFDAAFEVFLVFAFALAIVLTCFTAPGGHACSRARKQGMSRSSRAFLR